MGRPPKGVKRIYGDFEYQAASWDKPRRVIAKVEWHPGELFPRIGFVVTNMPMKPDWIIRFYNQRGTAEQHIKEGKLAINWTRLSCKGMAQNEVRLQLHALAYNLGVFLQGSALPDEIADWSLTSLQTRLIKSVRASSDMPVPLPSSLLKSASLVTCSIAFSRLSSGCVHLRVLHEGDSGKTGRKVA